MVSIGTLVAFITVSIGVIILRVREPDLPRRLQGSWLSRYAGLVCLCLHWVLYGLRWYTWVWFGVWVAAVLVFYLVWSRRHSALNAGAPTATSPPPFPATTTSCSSKNRRITTSSPSTRMSRDRRRRLPGRQERPVAAVPGRRGGEDGQDVADVVTVVPRPWMTPSPGRIDAEYAQYAEQLAADSQRKRRRSASTRSLTGLRSTTTRSPTARRPARPAGSGRRTRSRGAWCLGSSSDGKLGQVVVGSTADRLLHSSPVPTAISSARIPRVESRWADPDHSRLPGHAGDTACGGTRCGACRASSTSPMRVVTFAVRGRTMYPPEVGLQRRGLDPRSSWRRMRERRWRS